MPDIPANASAFGLDETLVSRILQTSRKGAVRSVSDDHLSTCGSPHISSLARVQVPCTIADKIRVGRLTALRKPDVTGNRCGAKTMARQLGTAVVAATAPRRHALSTRPDCECVNHSLQTMCEADLEFATTSGQCIGLRAETGNVLLRFLSSICFMDVRPIVCGRVRRTQCMPSNKVKEVNKGVH